MSKPRTDFASARASALAVDLRVLSGKLKRRLREEACLGDFTASQISVLRRLEHNGPATVTALAREEGVRPQSMGQTLAVLKKAGLVSGAPDPSDGRQTVLSLTAACIRKVSAGRAAHEDWLFGLIKTKLTPEEQDQFAIGIELLRRLLDS